MYNKYKGKKPCLGCYRPGEEKPRASVNSLCFDCKQLIRLGKGVKAETKKYGAVQLFLNAAGCLISEGLYTDVPRYHPDFSYKLAKALNELLKTIDQGIKPNCEHRIFAKDSSGNDFVYLSIETTLAYKNLIDTLAKYSAAVYEEGKKKGRSLLVGLADGEITLKDFEERIK